MQDMYTMNYYWQPLLAVDLQVSIAEPVVCCW